MHTLHRVLPDGAYRAVYGWSFGLYRAALAQRYALGVRRVSRRGDLAAALRGTRVASVMEWSLVGAGGLEQTHDLAMAALRDGIPGAFVECGVAQGGCAALIAQVAASENAGRGCWFFDSFEGLPDPTDEDFGGEDGRTGDHVRPLPAGSCLGTIEEVSGLLFDRFGLNPDRVTLVKGWFQDTLPARRADVGAVALLRVDGDWYDSTVCVLENLYDQVTPGGHVIIDDYGTCHGARRATDEFRTARGIETPLLADGRGGVAFVKPEGGASGARPSPPPSKGRRPARANGRPDAA